LAPGNATGNARSMEKKTPAGVAGADCPI